MTKDFYLMVAKEPVGHAFISTEYVTALTREQAIDVCSNFEDVFQVIRFEWVDGLVPDWTTGEDVSDDFRNALAASIAIRFYDDFFGCSGVFEAYALTRDLDPQSFGVHMTRDEWDGQEADRERESA